MAANDAEVFDAVERRERLADIPADVVKQFDAECKRQSKAIRKLAKAASK